MPVEDEIQQPSFKSAYHELAVNLHCTTSWFYRVSAAWLAPYDLSLQQYNVLRILRGQHPRTARATLVQDRMIDRMSNVSRLIEKLRQKGLVARRTCPTDRRAVDVTITDEGLALLATLDEAKDAWLDTFMRLTPEEADTLNQLLDKLRG
jgi:DNA-binding MarR family transcriptional regulator